MAKAFAHSEKWRGHANDYKPKTVVTRVRKASFDVTQVREGVFYLQALERELRFERALMLTLAEMIVFSVLLPHMAPGDQQDGQGRNRPEKDLDAQAADVPCREEGDTLR